MTNRRESGGIAWAPLVIGALLVAATVLVLSRPSKTDSFFGQAVGKPAPALRLTDHHGQPFTLAQLDRKLVLLTFGFTHCPNICPTTLGNLAAAYRELSDPEKARVQVVFVTVDPERDTVAKLAEYVPFFDPSFIGLTGSAAQIAQVAKDYGVFYEKSFLEGNDASNNYTLNHSSYTYLIAPGGNWALLFDYDQVGQPKKLAEDVKRVLAETPAS